MQVASLVVPTEGVAALVEPVLRIVLAKGYRRLDEPIRLASGGWSSDYVDLKRGLADGPDLRVACEALLHVIEGAGVTYDAVGGLTLGADSLSHGCAVLSGTSWFVVRRRVKDHGTKRRIEGAAVGPGSRVVLLEDVVTTGSSILEALEAVREAGADAVLAAALVDRGAGAEHRLAAAGVPYASVLTHGDLGIEPVPASSERA